MTAQGATGGQAHDARPVAVLIGCVGLGALVVGYAIPLVTEMRSESTVIGVVAAGLLIVGGMLTIRRPENVVCWLILVTGTLWAGLAFTSTYAHHALVAPSGPLPGATLAYWFATWLWVPGLVLLPVFVPLLFPDGHPPSQRWNLVLRAGILGVALVLLAQWTVPWGPSGYAYEWAPPKLSNPAHIALLDGPRDVLFGSGAVLVLVAGGAGLISATVRYRRSRGIERQQLRWVVFGAIGGLTLYVLTVLLDTTLVRDQRMTDAGIALALLSFPGSIAVGVLRYRLYDLDRIVSRTVSYAVVLVLLGGLYASGVVGLTTLLGSLTGGGGGDLAVAGSTLVVAALFRPVTRRVRDVVDRRFNRTRLDAVRTVERFSQCLRDEVELEVVGRELVGSVVVAVQPRSAHIWVPPRFRNASGTVEVHHGAAIPEAPG